MAEADPPPAAGRALPALDSFPVLRPSSSALSKSRIVGFDSRDIRSRPFNLLRTRLARTIQDQQLQLVGLTSATPAAGKSFLSLNLAAALARLGEWPVYLFDFDLRRASLAEQLKIEVSHGIEGFLTGEKSNLYELGLRVEGLPLVVFPTKVVSSHSAEMLSGGPLQALIAKIRAESEGAIALFDLPPVFANDDAMITIEELDAYLMVVDSGRTTKRQLTDAMDMLSPSVCLGTILNRYKGGIVDQYGYYSSKYDKYYSK